MIKTPNVASLALVTLGNATYKPICVSLSKVRYATVTVTHVFAKKNIANVNAIEKFL